MPVTQPRRVPSAEAAPVPVDRPLTEPLAPRSYTIASDCDEDLVPESLDFEGACGVFDHLEAPSEAAVNSPADCLGKRLFGKQTFEPRVRPPRSRSRSLEPICLLWQMIVHQRQQ